MKSSLPEQPWEPSRLPREKRASVLLITLSFVLLITVITVAFLVRSRGSLQTSQSYSKEIVAQEIGEIAIDKLAAEFQTEISKATNQAPQVFLPLPVRVGVTTAQLNPKNSALVRRTWGGDNSTATGYNNAYKAAGFTTVPHSDRASTISTDTPAKNGWRFDKQRWAKPGLLRTGTDGKLEPYTSPDWVYAYGQPRSNTSAAQDKMTDIVGRYAAMVYDVSGLFDINEAGSSLPLGDKGSTAFADLAGFFTAVSGSSDFSKFATWRSTTTGTTNDFYGDPTKSGPTYAGRIESPTATLSAGQNRFFSRMDFIEAATGTNSSALGLTPDLLPYFRTRSQASNRVSAEDLFITSGTTATVLSGTGLQPVSATAATKFSVTRIDGTTETYTVKKGNFLFPNRFPLARLRWLADRDASGNPQHQTEIKKYFGLTWDTANSIFIYTSPDQATAVGHIKTLQELATGINGGAIAPPREPDFFEWLKAAIDPNSLGQTGGSTDRIFSKTKSGIPGTGTIVAWEACKDLHLIRIGANIIDQSDADSIPTCIRSQFTDASGNSLTDPSPFDSYGQENIPYLNEVITSVYRSSASANLNGYMQFELWNPNRNAATSANPPLDYQGKPITTFKVRAINGPVLMMPFVYVSSVTAYKYIDAITGKAAAETTNGAWGAYQKIAQYSQGFLPFITPVDITKTAVAFTLATSGAGTFFSEPYLVNGSQPNGQDLTNPLTAKFNAVSRPLVLGAPPSDGVNAMLVCSVNAPHPAIPAGTKLSDLYTSISGTNTPVSTGSSGDKYYNAARFYSDGTTSNGVASKPVTLVVELTDASGITHTCQTYNNLAMGTRLTAFDRHGSVRSDDPNTYLEAKWSGTSNTSASGTTSACFYNWNEWQIRKGYPNTDPRTERFGFTDNIFATPGAGIRTDTTAYAFAMLSPVDIGDASSVGTSFANGNNVPSNEGPATGWGLCGNAPTVSVPADLAVNSGTPGGNASTHCYADADGKVRPADARYACAGAVNGSAHPALPVASFPNAAFSRPVVLNRPFRNVAELGCVFRDIPWKSLDLFSPDSPDRRLLDVFCIEDRVTTTGKINPNLATQETLRALLRNTGDVPTTNGAPLTSGTVSSTASNPVADMLATLNPITSSSNYILSNANIAQRLADPSSPASPASLANTGGYLSYKTRAESFARALSSMTDTRSWQLMLDVVTQSGKIPPQDAALGNLGGFVVDGQRRFFVYLTLDRLTGEILDKHIEPVYE